MYIEIANGERATQYYNLVRLQPRSQTETKVNFGKILALGSDFGIIIYFSMTSISNHLFSEIFRWFMHILQIFRNLWMVYAYSADWFMWN